MKQNKITTILKASFVFFLAVIGIVVRYLASSMINNAKPAEFESNSTSHMGIGMDFMGEYDD